QKTGFGVDRSEVAEYHVFGIDTAYPVYELNFEEHLIAVLKGVHSLENVLTIGRHGRLASIAPVRHRAHAVAVALQAHRRRVEQQLSAARAEARGHVLVQLADPGARVHVLGEVRGRIRLDAQRAQDDVLQIQLRDA